MKRSSLIRLLVFSLALYANIRYILFLLNPLHIGNPIFFVLNASADLIVLTVLTFTWLGCLHFEFMKDRYYGEIADLKEKGKDIVKEKVSVLVPVVGESMKIVTKTLAAVIAMKGDKDVFLLDDGNRDELEELAKSLKINYLRRNDRAFFKSGNLNHGFAHVKTEYVAVFDSDFVPNENFLVETLPLFADPKAGAVQTPQVYYNSENLFSQGMMYFQNLFYNYVMPSKHLLNSAFCVGTNVVYRKSAIDEIGGIPLVNHSEDVFTALKLTEHGYHVSYLKKDLAFGLSPNNIVSFFNQQYRWARGGLTMLFKHNTLFNKKLTLDQRIAFFGSNIYYLTGLSLLIYLINPFVAIFFDVKPINDVYFTEWLVSYGLFFLFNFVFYTLLTRKHRLQSMALGMLCLVPYISALTSVLLSRKFLWKPTNFLSSDLVTRAVWPFLTYLFVSVLILYLLASGVLVLKTNILWYVFWIMVNSFMIIYFVGVSYKSVFFDKR